MTNEIKIGPKIIGEDQPCFIIAEAGVNHNGNMETAKSLIKKAYECGADCIKFQTFKAARVVTRAAPKAKHQRETTDIGESQLTMLKKLEMTAAQHKKLMEYAKETGIVFMSTPYNFEDVDLLESINVPAYKVASAQIIELAFLKKIAKTGKSVFLSTGMATLREVKDAVRAIKREKNDRIILMQCTASYPASIEAANLNVIKAYKENLPFIVGYSDHTTDDLSAVMAVTLGARVVEKHFTLDKDLPGPDHVFSADPAEFSSYVKKIRMVSEALGSAVKEPSDSEKENIILLRRSIAAKRAIKKGSIIREADISFKRPATGLSPKYYDELIGKKAARDIGADNIIKRDMVRWEKAA